MALPDLALWEALCRGGETNPVAVLMQCLAQIDAHNVRLNAVIALDREGAERAALDSTRRWRGGAPLSPIDGAPILVKANFAVSGLPWHAGIAAYGERIAPADAPIVARLRAAGAVIVGLTNMDEAALGADGSNYWHGRIDNPRRPGFSAGGSSGGSAAAVAAGFCLAALGSDTIGSVAIPAAYCGVIGHRASRALMPLDGVIPLSPSFDHCGWHTRRAQDALVLGRAMGMSAAQARPLRIAAVTLDGLELDPDIVGLQAAGVEQLRTAGWAVDPVVLPVALKGIVQRMFEVAEAEGAAVHQQALAEHFEGFSPSLQRMLAWGAIAGARRRDDHLAELARTAAAIRGAAKGYDALLLPATPDRPFLVGSPQRGDQALFAAVPACLGWPATTVPGREDSGLALLVTAPSDAVCLRIAEALT